MPSSLNDFLLQLPCQFRKKGGVSGNANRQSPVGFGIFSGRFQILLPHDIELHMVDLQLYESLQQGGEFFPIGTAFEEIGEEF